MLHIRSNDFRILSNQVLWLQNMRRVSTIYAKRIVGKCGELRSIIGLHHSLQL